MPKKTEDYNEQDVAEHLFDEFVKTAGKMTPEEISEKKKFFLKRAKEIVQEISKRDLSADRDEQVRKEVAAFFASNQKTRKK